MVRACDLKATEQLPKRLLGHVWSTFALMFIVNTCGYVFINDFFDGSKATIFGRVSILLGDEAALKETLDCKGAAGTFFVLYVRTFVTTSLSFTVMIHVGTSSRARA